jgi:hypothetical protein
MMMMHSRMMWMCVAMVGIALILAATGVFAYAALFAIPCLLMMGMMVWMMVRMASRRGHSR